MNRSLKLTLWMISLLTVAGVWLGLSQYRSPPVELIDLGEQNCRPQLQWCETTIGEVTLRLKLPTEIHTMKIFPVKLEMQAVRETVVQHVMLQFQMKGMDMGMNQYVMNPQAGEEDMRHWQTDILLPVCRKGRSDWVMELLLTINQKRYRLSYLLQTA